MKKWGSVQVLATGFSARYTVDGRQRRLGFYETQEEAWDALAAKHAELDAPPLPLTGSTTFQDYALNTVMPARRLTKSPGTVQNNDSLLRNHLLPAFGDRALDEIKVSEVDLWHAQHQDTPSTTKNAYSLMHAIFKKALHDQLVTVSPCQVDGGFSDPSKRGEYYTPQEYLTVVDHLPQRLRIHAMLMINACLRINELVGVERGDIDLEAKTIHVQRQADPQHPQETRKLKSRAGDRVNPLPTPLVDLLKVYLKANPMTPAAPLFPAARGKGRMNAKYFYVEFKKAARAAGYPEMRPHSARHTMITRWHQMGYPQADIMARAGHSNMTMTSRYIHAAKKPDQGLADKSAIGF